MAHLLHKTNMLSQPTPQTSNHFPQSMSHLFHESNIPICRPASPILTEASVLQFTTYSRPSSVDAGGDMMGDKQNDESMVSDYSMGNDIPVDSEFDSASGYNSESRCTSIMPSSSSLIDIEMHSSAESAMVSAKDKRAEYPNEVHSEVPTHPASSNAHPSSGSSKGAQKVFNIFEATRRRAVDALKDATQKIKETRGGRSSKRTIGDVDDTSSDGESGDCKSEQVKKSHDPEKRPRKSPKAHQKMVAAGTHTNNVGISSSARASRLLNEQVNNGTFFKHPTKWSRFVATIVSLDQDAKFDIDDDPRKVQHSLCTKTLKMSEPYNTKAFKTHTANCSGPTKTVQRKLPPAGSQTLIGMAAIHNWKNTLAAGPSRTKSFVDLPCPGLGILNVPPALNQRFQNYLKRTPLTGGGGPTLEEATDLLFQGKQFTFLSDRQKNEVRSAQRQRYRWHNHADLQKIFSATCCQTIKVQQGTEPLPACASCAALLWDKTFKSALSVPLPCPEDLKYMPKVLVDQSAIDRFGYMSGLKDLIDAHMTVSHSFCECALFSHRSKIVYTGLAPSLHSLCQKSNQR
jgi:hypothetical protein